MKILKLQGLALIILSSILYSQQTTFDFLRMDISPRAAALSGAFVSNTDDPNVIFYNPAGLRQLTGTPISFSFAKHLMDINLASISASTEIGSIGRFGFGVQYINYGSFERADENGYKDGTTFGANEIALTAGYAGTIDDNFYYGINARFIGSFIDSYSSTALAADLGVQYLIPSERISIGVSALNMGGQLSSYVDKNEDLPLDVRVGISKRMEHLPLILFWSFNKLNEKTDNFGGRFKNFVLGGEFSLSRVLKLRLGFDNEKRKDLKVGTTAGLAGFNLGLGALINKYNFDYSYSSLGSIGALHRVGISTTF
ncbi:MAG: type IX secretion system protein PorQ [Bacteroidota bacterium]